MTEHEALPGSPNEQTGGEPRGPVPALRVAVIGYGLAGSAFHAPLVDVTPGLRVAAIVTGDPERSAAARARYPEATVLPEVAGVWAMADALDVAIVATPNRTHVPLAMAAMEAGLHVVVDKPLAATAADARSLLEAARRYERILTVYQNRRWDADFLTLRRLLEDGELGTVFRFESRFERWRPVPKPGWRQDPAPEAAGGLLFDLGAHLIDQALVLFGPVRDIYAELDQRRAGARVDDDVFIALHHDSGVRSHLWMNTIAARTAPRMRVLGSGGTWTKWGLDVQEERLRNGDDPDSEGFGAEPEPQWGTLDDGDTSRATPSEPGAYATFYEKLHRALREGEPPPVDAADAVTTLEIIEAARAT